jgi:hypothetical protein
VKVLTCSRTISRKEDHLQRYKEMDGRLWLSFLHLEHRICPLADSKLAMIVGAEDLTRHHGQPPWSYGQVPRVLNALRRPGASSECESREERKTPRFVMRDRKAGAWGFVCGRRGARMGRSGIGGGQAVRKG